MLTSWIILRIILIRYHNNSMNIFCLLAKNTQKQKPSQKQITDYWAGALEKSITKRVVAARDSRFGDDKTKNTTPT